MDDTVKIFIDDKEVDISKVRIEYMQQLITFDDNKTAASQLMLFVETMNGLAGLTAFNEIKQTFNNNYLNILSIIDHLHECLWEYQNRYKPKVNKEVLFNELADLHILLIILFEKEPYIPIVSQRIHRFIEKANENEQ